MTVKVRGGGLPRHLAFARFFEQAQVVLEPPDLRLVPLGMDAFGGLLAAVDKEVGLLEKGHEYPGMLLEIIIKGGGAALVRPYYQEIGNCYSPAFKLRLQ
jgi:hypothetical protein